MVISQFWQAKVNYLYSCWHMTHFGFRRIGEKQCWLHTTVSVVADQCLHSQGLCRFLCYLASKGARGAPEGGREQNQNSWSRLTEGIFYTLWHHVGQQKLWGLACKWEIAAQGLVRHWPVGCEHCASLAHLFIYVFVIINTIIIISPSISIPLKSLYLNPWVFSSFFIPILFPIPLGGGSCKWLCCV